MPRREAERIDQDTYLAVARVQKPHGLKGELAVWVLTDEPTAVLATGCALSPLNEEGHRVGEPVVIERSRPFQRQWLLKLETVEDRDTADTWRQAILGVPQRELQPPGKEQMYVHEIAGVEVVAHGQVIGVARRLTSVPGGELLEVRGDSGDHLIPFKKPIVLSVDRAARRIEIDPPPGLLDL